MTEERGRLSDRQWQQIRDWFEGKGVEPHCSQCGRTDMTFFGLVAVETVPAPGFASGKEGNALLPVMCKDCAHVEWFFPHFMNVDV